MTNELISIGKLSHLYNGKETRWRVHLKRQLAGSAVEEFSIVLIVITRKEVFAIDELCPHANGPLYLGDIEDIHSENGSRKIICPYHEYDFDLKTGKCTKHEQFSIEPYDVSVVDGEVFISLSQCALVKVEPVVRAKAELCAASPAEGNMNLVNKQPQTILEWAHYVLHTPNPELKVKRTRDAFNWWNENKSMERIFPKDSNIEPPVEPLRENLTFVEPWKASKRGKGGSLQSRISIIHSLANIEQWAIDLAWDIILRYAKDLHVDLRVDFITDFVKVANDESIHFELLCNRLNDFGSRYGDLPVHGALWESAQATSDDLLERLGIVHMVHEARGLDVNPSTIKKFELAGDKESVVSLTRIHNDEITHVAAGAKWFSLHCDTIGIKLQEEKVARFQDICRSKFRGKLKPPFNKQDRLKAGLSEECSSFVDRILSPLRRSEDGHGNVYVTSADDVAEYHALLYTKEFSSDNFSDSLALLRATRRPLIFTGLNSNDYETLTEFLPLMGFVGEDPALLLVHFLTDPTNNTHYYSFLISNKDAHLFENDTETEQFANDVRIHLNSFIIYCGGFDVEGCWDYIKLYSAGEERTEEMLYFQNHDTPAVEATMEPPGNAVWRLFLQTTYSYFKADSGMNYDFDGQQVSTFTTHSCYVYLQAEPESYLVFYNVKASHKTEPLVQNYDTVGYYFSNYQPGMSGTLSSTGNSLKMLHATPRSLNNTEPFNPKVIVNRYSREIDMAYGAIVTKDGLVIKDADAFTVSFVDERMITQWSVERHFNLNNHQGFWKYHQQFPVDTLQNDIEAHPDRWEEYFQVSGDACLVRDVSEHSALMIETSNSIGWIVDAEHRSKDGQTLLVDVSVGSKITMYATTCQYHKIIPVVSELQRTWRINIADLNNISKE